MENVRLSLESTGLPTFSVRRFDIQEGISRLFEVSLTVVSPDPTVSLDSLVHRPATVELSGGRGRRWEGLCTTASLLRVADDGSGGLATYSIRVAPRLFRLTQNRNRRIFQHRSIPSIVATLLDAWNIQHRFAVDGSRHPELELRTQHGESDFHFLSRLLEEAGISFFFEDAEPGGTSRLILTDAPQSREERPGSPIAFTEERSLADLSGGEFATDLQTRRSSRPGRVTLRDHDPRRPRVIPHVERAEGDDMERGHEQFHFLPNSFLQELAPGDLPGAGARASDGLAGPVHQLATSGPTPIADDRGIARHTTSFGAQAATTLLGALRTEASTLELTASVTDLSPGTVFRVIDHPGDLVSTTPWLAFHQELQGEVARPETWRFRVRAAPASRPYRPPMEHEKPRIHGLQTAVVVGAGADASGGPAAQRGAARAAELGLSVEAAGAAGLLEDDIHVDEMGRVRVQFPWDRLGKNDPDSYVWTRVSQGWAGAGYGLFTIPRVGHEVLVSFLDGDPDAPIIVGAVHNAIQPVPFKLPENKTVSTFRTQSSPGGAGANELRFDDAAGREHLYLRAQRDFYQTAELDFLRAIGGSKSSFTAGAETSLSAGDRVAFVGGTDTTASRSQINDVADDRHNTVRGEDRTLVGTRWSVTVARGLRARLPVAFQDSFDRAQGLLARGIDRAMASLPADPRSDGKLGDLLRAARSACGDLADLVGTRNTFDAAGGPTPTHLSVQDRQIVLSTGEASIVLDGPDIHLRAKGDIVLHAGEMVATYAGTGILQRAPEAVSHATTGAWVIQSKELHLNPLPSSPVEPDEHGEGSRPAEVVLAEIDRANSTGDPVFPPLLPDEDWIPDADDGPLLEGRDDA